MQLDTSDSAVIPAPLFPRSQVLQKAVTRHPSQVPQQTGSLAARYCSVCGNSAVVFQRKLTSTVRYLYRPDIFNRHTTPRSPQPNTLTIASAIVALVQIVNSLKDIWCYVEYGPA